MSEKLASMKTGIEIDIHLIGKKWLILKNKKDKLKYRRGKFPHIKEDMAL